MNEFNPQGTDMATIHELTKLSERDLQDRVVEPLLRHMGFTHVRNMSGPGERGKDLVAVKHEFGRAKLYAIQIKKFQFSGKSSSPKSLSAVIPQLREMLMEPVVDPLSNSPRVPERGLFITPYAIKRTALEASLTQIKDLERRELTIIDGPILIDQILEYMPSVVTEFSMETQYRLRVRSTADKIVESTAFGLPEPLQLHKIYVELDLSFGRTDREISTDAVRSLCSGSQNVTASPDELRSLMSTCATWFSAPLTIPGFDSSEVKDANKSVDVKIDLDPIINEAKRRFNEFLPQFALLEEVNLPRDRCDQIVDKGVSLCSAVAAIKDLPLINQHWKDSFDLALHREVDSPSLSSTALLNIFKPVATLTK